MDAITLPATFRFNINSYVRVKLTELGRERLRQHVDELNAFIRQHSPKAQLLPYDTVEEDADGWSEWQLWSLMPPLGCLHGVWLWFH